MQTSALLLRSPHGFKRFFSAAAARPRAALHIRGLGLRERMPPCEVERPRGTGDYLFMLFHDRASAGTEPGRNVAVGPDTLVIWKPGQGQFYGNREHGFEHSWLHCSGDRVRRILAETRLPIGRPFPALEVARFLQCLSDIHGELVTHLHPDLRLAGNFLENCLRELARLHLRPGRARRIDQPLLAVRRMIDEMPDRKISLADLARVAGMPAPTFSARFKRTFDLSPKAYLIQGRMRRAAYLLTHRNLSVTEVAAEVGYDDPFHFSKIFKKHLGLSPRAMRKGGRKLAS
jgi:AraC-like DNA-binding protein